MGQGFVNTRQHRNFFLVVFSNTRYTFVVRFPFQFAHFRYIVIGCFD